MKRANRSYPASPGELMDQANILARDLLYEAPDLDGRTMLRTWGEVVEAAGALWRQLPARSDLGGRIDVMDQLERSARSLHSVVNTGSKEVDPTLQEIGRLISRAADVIEDSDVNRPTRRWTAAQLNDAFAARVSLVHTVYVSAHAVAVALAEDAVDERLGRAPYVYTVSAAQLCQRIATVEELTCTYLDGHYPGAYDRRHRPPVDHDRLGAAVSAWDVHAQRLLTRQPTTADMVTIAATLAATAAAARHLWAAAAATGHVDPDRLRHEISPALETMVERWGASHTLWKTLRHPREQTDPTMHEATRELKAAMNELAWDGAAPATTEVIASRADPAVVVRALRRLQATVAGVSQTFEEAGRTAQFDVNPRTAVKLVKEKHFAPGDKTAVVPPKAVVHGTPVPLPRELRSRLEALCGGATNASRRALRATMAVSAARPDLQRAQARSQKTHQTLGRRQEHTTVASATPTTLVPSR